MEKGRPHMLKWGIGVAREVSRYLGDLIGIFPLVKFADKSWVRPQASHLTIHVCSVQRLCMLSLRCSRWQSISGDHREEHLYTYCLSNPRPSRAPSTIQEECPCLVRLLGSDSCDCSRSIQQPFPGLDHYCVRFSWPSYSLVGKQKGSQESAV